METDSNARQLWVLWLALPLTALNFSLCWNRLPTQIAMHYDVKGRPNSWASPDGARIFSLGFVSIVVLPHLGIKIPFDLGNY